MSFKDLQQQFMSYIRDLDAPLPDGLEARRMAIYRNLFFNNVNGFVSSAFPVLKSLYTDDDWHTLVRGFFAMHDCQTPIFIEIAKEFLQYLQTEYEPTSADPVFMLELAHYEWLELFVATIDEDAAEHAVDLIGLSSEALASMPLCLSRSAQVAQYQFDVQHISLDYQPIEALDVPVFFCVYRDEHDEVCFIKLSPLTAQVLAFLSETSRNQGHLTADESATGSPDNMAATYGSICTWLTNLYPQWESGALEQGCLQLLTQMAQKGVIKTRK